MRKNINRKETDSGGMIRKSKRLFSPVLLPVLMVLILLSGSPLLASDTMLMFVGEDLEVLSLASRREEAAWKAPAIADVVTREKIENAGDATLADILGKSAGFYINEREQGSVPFLRGIEDSVLFLYDTVPMGSAANKSVHNIDNEMSLAPVKRIEIVRGAGSVLWGPDAFAGVVNLVPFTGKEFQGFETGVGGASLDESRSAYCKFGVDKGSWSSFTSVSAKSAREDDRGFNVVRFWNDGVTPAAGPEGPRFGEETPGDSRYYDLYSSVSVADWLTLSARITDGRRVYTVQDRFENAVVGDDSEFIAWKEERSNPTQTLKLEASKSFGVDSGVRFTGYYTNSDVDLDIIDKTFKSSERSFYGELIYDRSMFTGNGLLTAGTSFRKTDFKDILLWQGFMPGYLVWNPEDEDHNLPRFETRDYENTLGSFFGQYRHKVRDLELWAGMRYDNHDRYEDGVSYNLGVSWSFSSSFLLKAIYGTAYRTPFEAPTSAKDKDVPLERINSANVQLAWKPEKSKKVSLTFFRNEIDNHTISERYLGDFISTPNSQTLLGAELEWDVKIMDNLSVTGNLTLLDNSGSDERSINDAGGVVIGDVFVPVINEAKYDYNPGVDTMANLALNWHLTPNITFVPELRYLSEARMYYMQMVDDYQEPYKPRPMACSDVWLVDMHLKINDIFPFCIDFFIENLFDEQYDIPGIYSLKKGDSFNAGVLIKMRW